MIRAGDTGSALVEAVVSAAVVAMVLLAVFHTQGDSERRHEAFAQRRMALMIARSQLSAVGSAIPTLPGESAGLDGDYSWRVRIEPSDEGSEQGAAPLDLVTVSVRRGQGGADLAVLKTLRLERTR